MKYSLSDIDIYFLSVTSHIDCIVTLCDKSCLSHGLCLYQVMMTLHFLNDVANDTDWSQTSNIKS